MTALLEIEKLEVTFGRTAAVRGASFTVAAGETHCLVGESGCGKSVTALSILRLIPTETGRIASGSIRFEGEELTTLPEQAMKRLRGHRISMIFQEPMTSLNPVLTVGTQIAENVTRHLGVSWKAARERARRELLAQAALFSVKDASVVVVNPTHLACALKYKDDEDQAPVVVASGEGDLAERIVRAARDYGVPIVRDVPLARALSELEVGDVIPEALYEAVAEILRTAWEESDPARTGE